MTVWALMLPFFLRPFVVFFFNSAFAGYGWRAENTHAPIPKGSHALCRQVNRVTFCTGAVRETVHFICQQYFNRTAGKPCRAVCAAHNQASAGEQLRQDCVAAFACFNIAVNFAQNFGIPYHRRDTAFTVILRHVDGRLYHQYRRRRKVGIPADDIVHNVAFPYLRCTHYDNFPNSGLGKSVHNLTLVRRTVGTPAPRL